MRLINRNDKQIRSYMCALALFASLDKQVAESLWDDGLEENVVINSLTTTSLARGWDCKDRHK
jgi:hypothetical protein